MVKEQDIVVLITVNTLVMEVREWCAGHSDFSRATPPSVPIKSTEEHEQLCCVRFINQKSTWNSLVGPA